ncbi:MAG: hypothetical protein PHN51_12065 [Candidatus Nanopelagicales bacterium]|nr:hypothetical protein [Candidatus Nanopelagicales bacterium]
MPKLPRVKTPRKTSELSASGLNREQRRELARTSNKLVDGSTRSNPNQHNALVAASSESWDDLMQLCQEVGQAVTELFDNVQAMTTYEHFAEILGDSIGEFNRYRVQFESDVSKFTDRMLAIRSKHADKTGPLKTLDDSMVYSDISMQYIGASQEVTSLLNLSVLSMFQLFSEGEQRLLAKNAELDAKGVTTVEPKVETAATLG